MKLRHFLFFLALVVIVVLVIVSVGQFQQFISVIKNINVFILLGAVLLRYLYYWSNTKYFQVYLKEFSRPVPFKTLFSAVMTMNFTNTIFPSIGVSGVAVLRKELRRHGVSAHTATVAQGFWYAFTAVGFVLLLLLSLLLLPFSSHVSQISFRLILIMLILLLVAAVASIALLLNPRIAERLAYILTRPINWLLRKLKRNSLSREELHELTKKLYETLGEFKSNWKLLVKPFWYSFINTVFDIASLYVVFLAFGLAPNPGIVMAAYLIALLASLLSIFTSGIGVYELSMVGILVGLGLGFDVSFSTAIVYRIIALWLFIPIGLYFYKRAMIDGK